MTSLSCQLPPPLREADFDALLAGVDPAPLRTHLAACPSCRTRFEQYRAFPRQLRRSLGRGDCPTPDILTDYQEERLPETRRTEVESHLGLCWRCNEELAAIATFAVAMEEEVRRAKSLAQGTKGGLSPVHDTPPRSPFDFSALFAPLITLFPRLRPAVGGLKGGGADEAIQRLTASTERVTVTLTTYSAPDRNVRARAMVLTTEDAESEDDDAPLRWAGAMWEMWCDHRPIATTLLDRDAEGELPTLPPGDYELRITAPFNERVVLSGIRIAGRGTTGARSEGRP